MKIIMFKRMTSSSYPITRSKIGSLSSICGKSLPTTGVICKSKTDSLPNVLWKDKTLIIILIKKIQVSLYLDSYHKILKKGIYVKIKINLETLGVINSTPLNILQILESTFIMACYLKTNYKPHKHNNAIYLFENNVLWLYCKSLNQKKAQVLSIFSTLTGT